MANFETINQGIGGSAAAVPVTNAQSWLVAITDQTNVIFTAAHPGYVQGAVTVSGSVAVTQGTSPWVVSNGGTFAVQAAQSGTWGVRLQDGAGNAITSDTRGSERPLAVEILDASGNQVTTFGSPNLSVGPTGSATPADATLGGLDVSGTLRAHSGLKVTGFYVAQIDLTSVNAVAMGSPAIFGSTPTGNSLSTNSSLFVDASGPHQLSAWSVGAKYAAAVDLTSCSGFALSTEAFGSAVSGSNNGLVVNAGLYGSQGSIIYSNGFGTAPAGGSTALAVNASVMAGTTALTATGTSLNVNITGGSSSGTQYTGSPAVGAGAIVTTAASGYDGANVRALLTSSTGQLHTIIDSATLGTVTVSGTVAVTQSTSPWVVSLTSTTITGTVAVTQSTSPWTIQGDSASGAANAGNPVKVGGAFNTTQPTVTNGQTVDAQMTARGAQIVATGVDTFNVTVNAALPAGSNVIGHVITDSGSTTVVTGTVAVTQSTSPWVVSGTVSANCSQTTSPWVVAGGLTNNNAAPGATNVGVLPALANAAPPSWTEGDQVLASTDLSGRMRVNAPPVLDSNNTRLTTLLANATYTGTATDVSNYESIRIWVYTDQASAAGGLTISFSADNVNYSVEQTFTITASNAEHIVLHRRAKYFKLSYTNGTTNQGIMQLQTYLEPIVIDQNVVQLSESIDGNDTGTLIRGVIVGQYTSGGGGYANVKVTSLGALNAAVTAADGDVYVRVASGGIASGAIASGAFAAGSISSGAAVSGAFASGAIVDLTNVTSALAATAPTKAISTSARAATALPTAVTDGQAVHPMADKYGRLAIAGGTVRDLIGTASVQTTDTSAHNLIASGGGSVKTDITFLSITNETATATVVSLSDGTTTYKFAIPASGGGPINLGRNALPATSAATAWTVTSSATVTLDFVAIYEKNA